MKHALIWPDEFGAIDKPKRIRCLDDDLNGPLNITPRIGRNAGHYLCKACGKKTMLQTKLCTREWCVSARGDA